MDWENIFIKQRLLKPLPPPHKFSGLESGCSGVDEAAWFQVVTQRPMFFPSVALLSFKTLFSSM